MKSKELKILSSVLAFVSQEGWTPAAFVLGVKKAGVSTVEAKKLFPHGIEDIVEAFHQSINDDMQVRMKAKRNFTAMRVRDKVAFAVRVRLEFLAPHRDAMRRLLLCSLLPRNVGMAARHLWRVVDAIWVAAGDTSTDYNYYTKRLLLIAVMKSTLSFWLNDNSKDSSETWAFLDRRIADVLAVGKGISVAKAVGVEDIVAFVKGRFAA